MRARNDRGFSLVELMVVVLIIGILVGIAVPVFVMAKRRAQLNACFQNQRTVESAYTNYLANHSEELVSPPGSWDDLIALIVPANVAREPECPGGGTYTWIDGKISCTVHGRYPTK